MRTTIYIRKENQERWEEVCAAVGGSAWINAKLEERRPSGEGYVKTATALQGKHFKETKVEPTEDWGA